jgi:hypothetical protein
MYVRLSAKQIEGIFATGSAACARSTTIEAPSAALQERIVEILSKTTGSGSPHREDGAVIADTGGLVMREEWLVQTTSFGPKTTVTLRAARAVRTWAILVAWFVLPNVLGVALAAALFLVMDRVPGFAPGAAWIAGVIISIVGSQAIAKASAGRWTQDAHVMLVHMEKQLEASFGTPGYRT